MDKNDTDMTVMPCMMFAGDSDKCDAVLIVKRVSAGLSIVGSAFTIFLIVLYKKFTAAPQRMILNLSVASLFFAVTFLMEDIVYEATALCKVQGACMMYFIAVCLFWIMSILLNLYLKVVWDISLLRHEIVLSVLCWGLPVILTALPFIDDAYAPAGAWCWLTNDWRWRFGLWYIWRISSILIFVVLMTHMAVVIHRNKQSQRHSNAMTLTSIDEDLRTLTLYPVVYFIVNLFPIVNRLYNAISGDKDQQGYDFTLLLLQCICDPLYGAAVALVYVLDGETRRRLTINNFRDALHKWTSPTAAIQEYNQREPTRATHI